MIKTILVCTLLIASSMAAPAWASAIQDSNWGELGSSDWNTGKKNSTGTAVFFGMQGCGRTSYWAPKIKKWVAKQKAAGSPAGKLTYKFMGCKTGNNMNTCWGEGVRQLPGMGIYDANGKQTNFYMNTSGMKKFMEDNKAGAANPPAAQANATKTAAKKAEDKKTAPAKSAVAPKSKFAKLVITNRTKASGIVPLTDKTLDAFTKKHDEAVVFFGSAADRYSANYGRYWGQWMNREMGKDNKKLKAMGAAVIDCDDYSKTCFSEGVWSMPTMALYRKDKIVKTWNAESFQKFLNELSSSKRTDSFPKVNKARNQTLKRLFKSIGAPKDIMYLTRDNWFEVASQPKFTDGDVHIFYGSAGCGWTKHWAPKFLKHIAARKAAGVDPKTDYAFVDCNDDMPLCWKANVRKYPHVTVWSQGKSVAAFGGDDGMKSWVSQYPTNANNSDAEKGVSKGKADKGAKESAKTESDMQSMSGYVFYTNSENMSLATKVKTIFGYKGKELKIIDCNELQELCGSEAVMKNLPVMVQYDSGSRKGTWNGLPSIVGQLQTFRRRRLVSKRH